MRANTLLRFRRSGRDEGFTLIEIMVSIGLVAIVATALLPLLIGGLRAATQAKFNTQAKNLVQARFEGMRNLPYHVAQSAGPYVDVLDTYFHNLQANDTSNTRCDSAGYSSATATYTCTLNGNGKLNFTGFNMTVASQFLSDQNGSVVTPPSTYDSQSASGYDVPPAQMIGVTITVTWVRASATRQYSSYSQIGAGAAGKPQAIANIRDSAVSIDTSTDDSLTPALAHFDGGLVNADASLSTGASANANVQGAYGSFSTGETSSGQAAGTLDAPPNQTSFTGVTGTSSTGVPTSQGILSFGPTSVANVTGVASSGVPAVASSANPLTAVLTKSGSAGARGFWFSNVPTQGVQLALTRLKVQDPLNPPTSGNPTQLVRDVQGSSSSGYAVTCGTASAISNADFLTSTGYITTTNGTNHSVSSCATATTRRVDIFPTYAGGATNGVVQITLNYASLACSATGSAASATPLYSATVSYWSQAANSYVNLTIANGQSSDPLTAALLTRSTSTGGVVVGTDPSGNPLYLGDYIKTWSSGTFSGGGQSGNTVGQGDLTVLSIGTVPTRDTDTTGQSSINLQVGHLSCLAEDNR